MSDHVGVGPRVSVIIPSGRPERVTATVQSLMEQSLARSEYEIVVVTPVAAALGSGTWDGLRLVETGTLFPPGAMRNLGAEAARGEILCFVDDDCLAPRDWLAKMTQAIRQADDIGAVGCRVVAQEKGFWNRCADQALFTAYQGFRSGNTAALGSAALAVRRTAFAEAGGFDADLLASEDWDFSLKLQEKGWRCWFAATTAVRHDHRRGGLWLILWAAWRSGRASGLAVQRRHIGSISWLARFMARAGHPALYWLMMLPYAGLATLLWLVEIRPSVALWPALPWVFFSRCAYQLGVWQSLGGVAEKKHEEAVRHA